MIQSTLQQARRSHNVSLHDVAFLANLDNSYLSRIEQNKRTIPLSVALLYHRLFGVSLLELCKEEYLQQTKQIIERAYLLMNMLQTSSSPKSERRIQYLQDIVQYFTTQYDESK